MLNAPNEKHALQRGPGRRAQRTQVANMQKNTHTHMRTSLSLSLYIYIYRERERDRYASYMYISWRIDVPVVATFTL